VATGYNIVDVKAAKEFGVIVTNIPTYGTNAVSQYVFALLLEICHHAWAHSEEVKRGAWTECLDFCFWNYPLIELSGKTMGIIGLGRIGRATAKIAQSFGMKVLAYDDYQNKEFWVPKESRERLMNIAVSNLKAYLAESPQNIVS
jgi:glycerate dehydrogenase